MYNYVTFSFCGNEEWQDTTTTASATTSDNEYILYYDPTTGIYDEGLIQIPATLKESKSENECLGFELQYLNIDTVATFVT
jgi:hypothetical protein